MACAGAISPGCSGHYQDVCSYKLTCSLFSIYKAILCCGSDISVVLLSDSVFRLIIGTVAHLGLGFRHVLGVYNNNSLLPPAVLSSQSKYMRFLTTIWVDHEQTCSWSCSICRRPSQAATGLRPPTTTTIPARAGLPRSPPGLVATLRMQLQPGTCPFPVLGFWGKITMPSAGIMAYRRDLPSTTRI